MQKLVSRLKKRLRKKSLENKMQDCLLFLELKYPFDLVNQRLSLKCQSLSTYLQIVLKDIYPSLDSYLSDIRILKFASWKESLSKKIYKTYLLEGIYPSVLFLAYVFLLLIYSYVFLPSVTSMLSDLSTESSLLAHMSFQLSLHGGFMFLILILLLFVFYIYKSKDLRVILFLKLHQHNVYKPIKLLWTHHFVLYFRAFYEEGLDTKTILDLIRKIPSPLPASWLAYHLDANFMEGKRWELDYLDDFFSLRIQQTDDFHSTMKALDDFIFMSEQEINRYFHAFIRTLKGGISLCLIAMITLYYQTLYLPLTILQTL